MIKSIIVAVDLGGAIGLNNELPWHLPKDLEIFKQRTLGHFLIVGRKTFESIGGPLPGRTMIVVTRDKDFNPGTGSYVVHSIEAAFELAADHDEEEVFIIGGREIYARTLDRADKMYATLVYAYVEADQFFPEFNDDQWLEIEQTKFPSDENNPYGFEIKTFIRKGPAWTG